MNYESFNKSLFRIRLTTKQSAFKHTTRTASKEMGISAPTFSRLINEKIIPDLLTYYKCCKWLNLDMNFFFEDYETN